MLNCGGPEARLSPLSVKGMKYFNLNTAGKMDVGFLVMYKTVIKWPWNQTWTDFFYDNSP